MSGHLYSPDEEIMFRTSESIAQVKGFIIDPIQEGGDRFTDVGKEGKFFGHYGLGQSLLAVPFYWAGNLISALNIQIIPDGIRSNTIAYYDRNLENDIHRFTVSRFQQVLTALVCVLLFQFGLMLGYSRKSSFLLALIYGTATMAFPFAKTFYSEPTTTLLLLSSFMCLYKFKLTNNLHYLSASGALLGYSLLTRVDSIILIPIFLIYLIYLEGTERLRPAPLKVLFKRVIYWGIPLAVFAFLVGLYNYVRFSSFTHTGYESEGLTFSYPFLDGFYGLLMSSGKSIFIFSPPILLFFPAIKKFWNEHRPEALFCSGLALSYILFYSKWESWAGGWTWGPRHVFQIHLFLLIPVLALFEKHLASKNKAFWLSVGALFALGIFVQIPGVLVSFMDYNYRFQFDNPLFYTLYIPVHSAVAGQWQYMVPGFIDLFFYQLFLNGQSLWARMAFIIPLLVTIICGVLSFRQIIKGENASNPVKPEPRETE
jgi:hypothetical protein